MARSNDLKVIYPAILSSKISQVSIKSCWALEYNYAKTMRNYQNLTISNTFPGFPVTISRKQVVEMKDKKHPRREG